MDPAFAAFEALLLGTFAALAWSARRDRAALLWLASLGAYGLALEAATIAAFEYHAYGRFAVMLGPVPVGIGLGWASILYAADDLARGARGPWSRAALAALLATGVDLTMDAVAIRLGYWTWSVDGAWFGVPLVNFYGWLLVPFLAVGWRGGLTRLGGAAAPAAVGASLLCLLPLISLWLLAVPPLAEGGILAVLVVAFGWTAWRGRGQAAPSASSALAHAAFHVFFLAAAVALVATGGAPAALAGVGLAVAAAFALLPLHPRFSGRPHAVARL